MKTIYNKFIPFQGFFAINLFGFLFVRKNADGSKPRVSPQTYNHENIHTAQMKELLYIGFYILYFIEWLIRLITNTKEAYRSISFEREAYTNQYDYEYLNRREPYAWIKFLKK